SPGGQPPHLVGLGDQGAVVDGFELVAPHGRLAATLLGDKGELPARVGGEDPAVTRPAEPLERTAPVVAGEPGAPRRPRGCAFPLDTLALGAPLAHAREVGDQGVDVLRDGVDDHLLTVLCQPPPSLACRHRSLSLSIAWPWLHAQATIVSESCQQEDVLR